MLMMRPILASTSYWTSSLTLILCTLLICLSCTYATQEEQQQQQQLQQRPQWKSPLQTTTVKTQDGDLSDQVVSTPVPTNHAPTITATNIHNNVTIITEASVAANTTTTTATTPVTIHKINTTDALPIGPPSISNISASNNNDLQPTSNISLQQQPQQTHTLGTHPGLMLPPTLFDHSLQEQPQITASKAPEKNDQNPLGVSVPLVDLTTSETSRVWPSSWADVDDLIDMINGTSSPPTSTSSYPQQSPKSQLVATNSTVHPLLIYSTRYEIRSHDLSHPLSRYFAPYSNPSFAPHDVPNYGAKNSKILIAGLKNTIGLDFYCSENENFIFWTDVIEERIYKGIILNGAIINVEIVIQSGLAAAEGLAVDWIGKNIYWVESTLDHIQVANMNGSFRRTLIAGDMESPRAIVVDPRHGLLFWTDWDKKSPRIERATMSGDDRETLIHIKDVKGGWPNGLTLDYERLKIYWIDANSDSIHVVDYDGNNHQSLLKQIKSLGHPFSITLYENNLYWTDWRTNSVSMANKYNGLDARELQGLNSKPFDIKVVHPSRQPKIDNNLNPCFINNGQCSHLCLLSTNHTRKCDCPHLMRLTEDNTTCETYERVLLIGRTNEIRAVDIKQPLHHIMAPISVPKVFNPKQFEYDSKTKSIFWVDAQTNEVKRALLVGSGIDTIIDVIIDSPSGLALDWISGNIYVTSASQHQTSGKIFISNSNGEYISILMDSSHGIVSPKSIAVHPVLGLLFCVDETLNSEPIIFLASMDGQGKRIITSKLNDPRLENPTSLAVDYESNRVYWVNSPGNSSSIQYYDILQDKIVTILDESDKKQSDRINAGILCVDGDYLIVSSRIPNEALIRMSKNDLSDRTTLRTNNLDQFTALRVYNASSQIGSNACSINNGDCSQLCIPTASQHRVCKCTLGYSNNGSQETHCLGKDSLIIYSYNLGMKGLSLEPSASPDEYYMPPIHRAFRASSIDFVSRDNFIYWVDNEEGSITRINRDTTNYQVIVNGLESEESIAVDWVAGNLYWLDPYYDTIQVARLNGTNRYVIVSGNMDKANGIVVNPIKGYIVWSDVGSIPKIEIAQLDGSNRRVIVNTSLTRVDDLAVDYVGDYIYWLDSTIPIIERIKDDGTGRQIVYTPGPNRTSHDHLVSIAVHKDYLYIADSFQHQGSIIRCDKGNASAREVIHKHLGEGIRDITVFAEQPMPSPKENPCVKDNGGCQDLCIYMGKAQNSKKGKKRCICSHGRLKPDGLTCEPYGTFVLFSKLSQIDSLHITEGESFNNSPYPPIIFENRTSIISLTVDYTAQRVIYSDMTFNLICSVLFNGTDRKVLVEKETLVEGIAFAHDQLYWTSILDNSISRLNTTSLGVRGETCDSSGCRSAQIEKIIKLGSEDKPRGIAIDSCTSYIYWTNWNTNATIQRAGPENGYKIESIIKTSIRVPNGIAIDQMMRKVYWCDAKLDKIEVCDMDGSNRIVLISAAPQHPFALAIWENYVFWTDWLARGVFRADKYTGQQSLQIKRVIQRPMGIAVAAPDVLECPKDDCGKSGICPAQHKCVLQGKNYECKSLELSHDVKLPAPKCRHTKDGSQCDQVSYEDIIMGKVDTRYNLTGAIQSLIPLHRPDEYKTREHQTIEPRIERPHSPRLPFSISTFNTSLSSNSAPKLNKDETVTKTPLVMVDTNSPFNNITPLPVAPKSTEQPNQFASNSTSESSTYSSQTTTTANLAQTSSSQMPATNSTLPPCQIVPAALHPTTDSSSNNGCKPSGEFKCYLSEKLVCISGEKRCDGSPDCPSKEDENDCYIGAKDYNLIGYNHKVESNWHRYVTLILIILAMAVAAMFLVFGSRSMVFGRRRWFAGTNGAFNHRRMFDDNGTNIEISNPMFDEDDSADLTHCAFSIDLNERTTNFSNPLYERQVLLMNDKHM